jgi:hypothetical protein
MTPNKPTIRNQKGQSSVEMVLIITVLVAIAITVSEGFRKNELFAKLVSGPWQSLAGLIQNGVWGTPKDTYSQHPNQFERVNTVRGEVLK